MIIPCVLLTANRQNLSTSFKTQLAVLVTTGNLRRHSIAEFNCAPCDAPHATDCAIEVDLVRVTADGTGTAQTPPFINQLETGTQLAIPETCKGGYTVEPTVTAGSMIESYSFNQRGGCRWVANDYESEPKAPAVAANGFALRALVSTGSAYASKVTAGLKFRV